MMNVLHFYASLTKRQQEVAQLVAEGYSNIEVAQALNVEPCVIAEHLTTIYGELHNAVDTLSNKRPNRYVLIRELTILFVHYPELKHPQGKDQEKRA